MCAGIQAQMYIAFWPKLGYLLLDMQQKSIKEALFSPNSKL